MSSDRDDPNVPNWGPSRCESESPDVRLQPVIEHQPVAAPAVIVEGLNLNAVLGRLRDQIDEVIRGAGGIAVLIRPAGEEAVPCQVVALAVVTLMNPQ